MRPIVSCEKTISSGALLNLKRIIWREFYEGELEAETLGEGDFCLAKSPSFPFPLTRLSSMHCNLGYRRSLPHIRGNQAGLRTIWFVRKGTLNIVRSYGSYEVRAGQVGFIDPKIPFHAKAICNKSGEYDSYQIMVPEPLFLMHLKRADQLMAPLDLCGAQGNVVSGILDVLIRDEETLSQRAALPLTDGLLVALSEILD